jgi:hypothetical protein
MLFELPQESFDPAQPYEFNKPTAIGWSLTSLTRTRAEALGNHLVLVHDMDDNGFLELDDHGELIRLDEHGDPIIESPVLDVRFVA